jgi:hypothetical protein
MKDHRTLGMPDDIGNHRLNKFLSTQASSVHPKRPRSLTA